MKTEQLEIDQNKIKQAYDNLDDKTRSALEHSYNRIRAYQEQIKIQYVSNHQGECYEIHHPIERVGIYVPGGKASYSSTVLMIATLAQVAGVKEITVVTPPQTNGICQEVLAACHITGVNHVYQMGGAQSIAALAYGTESISKVDKIVGPRNQFVYGQVCIDQIAGPTEIALIIDETADLEAITYDVFAQAEHDEMACTYVISEHEQILKRLEIMIQDQLQYVERQDIVSTSIAKHHYLILVEDIEEACLVMNTIAPEHASIQTKLPEVYVDKVKYVGALFLRYYSPEVIGGYVAGPSHVLPTNQTARFTNGLSVNDFMTRHSVIHLSQQTFNEVAQSAEHIAHIELYIIMKSRSIYVDKEGIG
ncbi:histidinol dehydrogenase [Staphylococcus saccharolyticus]|uniref:histidinol dehydrogenase n=1 Tax=Staphylococcus saccharolyticus TaxID=33028 RepID=A0A380GX15_9STAP|nr:histidinol dehydrogenase [Staphylococcus saccharolyticus]